MSRYYKRKKPKKYMSNNNIIIYNIINTYYKQRNFPDKAHQKRKQRYIILSIYVEYVYINH